MSFDIGDLIQHNSGGLEYTVLDVDDEGMTIRVYPRGPHSAMWIDRSTWNLWHLVSRDPVFQVGDILTMKTEASFRVEIISIQSDGYRARFLTGERREATLGFAEANLCTRVTPKRRRNLDLG